MAQAIRQPINLDNLQRWIEANVPEIKTPLEVKQVRTLSSLITSMMLFEQLHEMDVHVE